MNEIRKSRNRELFIEVACDIIEKQGVEAATIRNIAAKAGYNSATIYSYFQNLSHLILCAHLKFEEEIMQLMMEKVDNSKYTYYELWPNMYLVMVRYYLAHPNAFECSFLYKNEVGNERKILMLREEKSLFQKYIFENLQKIAIEKNVTMDAVLEVNQSCIALMVGTLLLIIRKRVNLTEATLLIQLQKSIEIMIQSMK